jgi:hypothetical protein
MSNGIKDVQFGDPGLCSKQESDEDRAMDVLLQAFLEGRVKVCRECTEVADDALGDALIMKQEAYEKAETVLRNVWVHPETLHEAYDLIKPLYDKHDHATTYRDRVGYVLTTIAAALEGTEYAIGKSLPLGEWCICTGNESKAAYDVQFGDPELMQGPKWLEIPLVEGQKLGRCEHYTCLMICLLPSGNTVYFWSNRYRYDFEMVYDTSEPITGKVVFIKNKGYGGCGRTAKYDNGKSVSCGPCCGREPLPPNAPTLTIEILESAALHPDEPLEMWFNPYEGTEGHKREGNKAKHYPVEFELAGKAETYPGSALGADAQDAIKTFLASFSSPTGTIKAIRVTGPTSAGKSAKESELEGWE